MGKNIKLFEQQSEYNEFKNSSQFLSPNISYAKKERKVNYSASGATLIASGQGHNMPWDD
jgi:hypothetical protein